MALNLSGPLLTRPNFRYILLKFRYAGRTDCFPVVYRKIRYGWHVCCGSNLDSTAYTTSCSHYKCGLIFVNHTYMLGQLEHAKMAIESRAVHKSAIYAVIAYVDFVKRSCSWEILICPILICPILILSQQTR